MILLLKKVSSEPSLVQEESRPDKQINAKDILLCKDRDENYVLIGLYNGILNTENIDEILEKLVLTQEKINTRDIRFIIISRGSDDKVRTIIKPIFRRSAKHIG